MLRVVTWNVRSLRDDRRRVAAELRGLAPDVVCVQEAPRFFRAGSLLAVLAREAGLSVACGGRSTRGTAVLVGPDVAVLGTREVCFPRTGRLHRRGVALARLSVVGGEVSVASVHLGLDAAERAAHASLIRGELEALADHGPIVVAGDLNETVDRPAAQILTAGLRDTGAQAGPTFPAARPRRRIDVILASPELAGEATAVQRPGIEQASDHLPVVADLTWW